MEPVPTTRSVRRTVRVAVALVVGQALLCALIGFLTLGRSGDAVDRMAEPPLVPPPTTGTGTPSPSASATSMSATATTRAVQPARDATSTRGKRKPSPTPVTVAPEPPPNPMIDFPAPVTSPTPSMSSTATTTATATSAPPPNELIPPLPPVPPSGSVAPPVQRPVVAGDPCAPEWAFGLASDGTLVRCVRTWHHRLRWKIV